MEELKVDIISSESIKEETSLVRIPVSKLYSSYDSIEMIEYYHAVDFTEDTCVTILPSYRGYDIRNISIILGESISKISLDIGHTTVWSYKVNPHSPSIVNVPFFKTLTPFLQTLTNSNLTFTVVAEKGCKIFFVYEQVRGISYKIEKVREFLKDICFVDFIPAISNGNVVSGKITYWHLCSFVKEDEGHSRPPEFYPCPSFDCMCTTYSEKTKICIIYTRADSFLSSVKNYKFHYPVSFGVTDSENCMQHITVKIDVCDMEKFKQDLAEIMGESSFLIMDQGFASEISEKLIPHRDKMKNDFYEMYNKLKITEDRVLCLPSDPDKKY